LDGNGKKQPLEVDGLVPWSSVLVELRDREIKCSSFSRSQGIQVEADLSALINGCASYRCRPGQDPSEDPPSRILKGVALGRPTPSMQVDPLGGRKFE
jgi:hypothetical protein